MQPKIFITPWVALSDAEIRECIAAGAGSARIHTGRHTPERINTLIDYYEREHFKFYLDLRGNKASLTCIDKNLDELKLELGQKVLVYDSRKPAPRASKLFFKHFLGLNFIPQAVLKPVNGNLAIDDGRIILQIDKVHETINPIATRLECTVNKPGKVFTGDGISSTDIFIHSGSTEPFTELDLEILKRIPASRRIKISYVAVSFAETLEHISKAQKILKDLNFSNCIVVPKIETILGVKNLRTICKKLKLDYGAKAEVQIGRGDLSLDCTRLAPTTNVSGVVDLAIYICKQYEVKVSVLALIMYSIRKRIKENPKLLDLEPLPEEIAYIRHLCELGVDQIGLTSDMYVDKPEMMVAKLIGLISTN